MAPSHGEGNGKGHSLSGKRTPGLQNGVGKQLLLQGRLPNPVPKNLAAVLVYKARASYVLYYLIGPGIFPPDRKIL